MEKNVGGFDRTMRIVLGLGLVIASMATVIFGGDLGETAQIGLAGVTLLAGAILLGTAGSQKCVINRMLGIDTYEGDAEERGLR